MAMHACAALKASVLLTVLLCSLRSCAEAAGNAQPPGKNTNEMPFSRESQDVGCGHSARRLLGSAAAAGAAAAAADGNTATIPTDTGSAPSGRKTPGNPGKKTVRGPTTVPTVTPGSNSTKVPGNNSSMPRSSEDTPKRSFVSLPDGWDTVKGSTDLDCAVNSTVLDLVGCKCTATRTITFEDWSTTDSETHTIRPNRETVFFDEAVRDDHAEVVPRLAVVPASPPEPRSIAISVAYSNKYGGACEMPSVHFTLRCHELKRVSDSGSWYAFWQTTSANPSYLDYLIPRETVEFVADKLVYTIPKFTYTGESLTHTNGYAPFVLELPKTSKDCCDPKSHTLLKGNICRLPTSACMEAARCDGNPECPTSRSRPNNTQCSWSKPTAPKTHDPDHPKTHYPTRWFHAQLSAYIDPATADAATSAAPTSEVAKMMFSPQHSHDWPLCTAKCVAGVCELPSRHPECCYVHHSRKGYGGDYYGGAAATMWREDGDSELELVCFP